MPILKDRCNAKHAPDHECNRRKGHTGRHLCWQGCRPPMLSAPSKRWTRGPRGRD